MILDNADAISALKQNVVACKYAVMFLDFLNFAKAIHAADTLPKNNL